MAFVKGHPFCGSKKKPKPPLRPKPIGREERTADITLKVGKESITVKDSGVGQKIEFNSRALDPFTPDDLDYTFFPEIAETTDSSDDEFDDDLPNDVPGNEDDEEQENNNGHVVCGEDVYQKNQDPMSSASLLDIGTTPEELATLIPYIKKRRYAKSKKISDEDLQADHDLLTTVYDPTAVVDRSKINSDAYTEALFLRAAFEYYYALGANRTLDQVHHHCHIGYERLYAIATKYKWLERVKEREERILNDPALHTHTQSNRVKKAALDAIAKRITEKISIDKDGNVKVQGLEIRNVRELREAMDLYRELRGEMMGGGARQPNARVNEPQAVKVQLIIKGR